MDKNTSGLLENTEFIKGMTLIFCGNYDTITELIFNIYDFDKNGKISKEDVRTVLSYISLTKEKFVFQDRVRSQEEIFDIIEECFEGHDSMSLSLFRKVIEKKNSDIFLLLLLFILQSKPFSDETFKNYINSEKDAVASPKTAQKLIASPSKRTTFSPYKIFISKEDKVSEEAGFKRRSRKTGSVKLKNFDIVSLLKSGNDSPKKEVKDKIKRRNRQSKTLRNTGLLEDYQPPVHRKVNQNLKTLEKNKKPYQHEDVNIMPAFEESRNKDDDGDSESIEEENVVNFSDSEEEEEEKKENDNTPISHEGYLYKITDGKIKRIWFKLINKDFFFLKNQSDLEHKGMHNLSGVFVIDLKKQVSIGTKKFFQFKLKYAKKIKEYYTETEEEYNKWITVLKKATGYTNLLDTYVVKNKLGNGKFGLIKLGINKITGEKVAIKIISKKSMKSLDLELVRTEIEILKICQHPNIIRLYEVLENDEYFYIVMEYCAGGDLFSYLERRKFKISEEQACKLMNQMCAAVYYIHSYGVVHRDLKPENILMTSNAEDAEIRILDFGLGKMLGPNETSDEPYGTLSYAAPEILSDMPYGKEVDLFSLGVITYLLLSGSLPFDHKSDESEIARKTVYEDPPYAGSIWYKISNEAIDFVDKLLIKNPKKRMTINEALVHPWMKKFCGSIVQKRSEKKSEDETFQLYSTANVGDLEDN